MQAKHQQQKAWVYQFKVLNRKKDSFGKEVSRLFPFSVTVHPFSEKISNMLQEQNKSEENINKEQLLTKNKLQYIYKHLNDFKQTLKYFQHTNQFLVKVSNLSQNIYSKMEAFKVKMADGYDNLAESEDKLTNELQFYQKKIISIENGEQVSPPQAVNLKNNQENMYMNKQIMVKQKKSEENTEIPNKIEKLQRKMKQKQDYCQNLQKKIQQLGKNLGWVEEDHKDFITIWNRGQQSKKNYFEVEDQLKNYFNLYTEEQIKDHMKKHMQWKNLTEEKKECIYQYKLLKEEKKNEELLNIQMIEDQSAKQQKKEEERIKHQKQQRQLKEKVQIWKQQKQQRKKQIQQAKMQYERQKKIAEKEKKNIEEQKRKQMLQQWKVQQFEKKRQTVENSRKRPVSAINKETEQRIKEREQKLIQQRIQRATEKKIQAQQLKKKEEQIKEKKLAKFAYVNSKVQEKTTAIKFKQRQKFDGINGKDANTFGGKLLMTGIRAIPSWRQGL